MMKKISLLAAYLSLIALWSTTPLAIKWSGDGPGFMFGATLRMAIGTLCIVSILAVMRKRLSWNRRAKLTYLAIALQMYGSMILIYWAAQFIPSGWISVIFGLTPFITALLAAPILKEKSLGAGKLFSYLLSVCGLALMFSSAIELEKRALSGILGVLLAALLHSASSIWVKHINARLPALEQVAGGLLFVMPAYLVSWLYHDGARWPSDIPQHSLLSILYLGVVATSLGFALYYYVLTHMPATKVAFLTIVSPVIALLLGNAVNGEALTAKVSAGSSLILAGLIAHQVVDRRLQKGIRTELD